MNCEKLFPTNLAEQVVTGAQLSCQFVGRVEADPFSWQFELYFVGARNVTEIFHQTHDPWILSVIYSGIVEISNQTHLMS